MAKPKNPSKNPPVSVPPFTPPPTLVRPRNGERTGDALDTEKLSDHSGGGKSKAPFIPTADRSPGIAAD